MVCLWLQTISEGRSTSISCSSLSSSSQQVNNHSKSFLINSTDLRATIHHTDVGQTRAQRLVAKALFDDLVICPFLQARLGSTRGTSGHTHSHIRTFYALYSALFCAWNMMGSYTYRTGKLFDVVYLMGETSNKMQWSQLILTP